MEVFSLYMCPDAALLITRELRRSFQHHFYLNLRTFFCFWFFNTTKLQTIYCTNNKLYYQDLIIIFCNVPYCVPIKGEHKSYYHHNIECYYIAVWAMILLRMHSYMHSFLQSILRIFESVQKSNHVMRDSSYDLHNFKS